MRLNSQFLAEFMRTVDMNLFTPSLYKFFTDFLSIERVRRYGPQYVISNFIPPFPGKAFERFITTFFASENVSGIQAVDLAVTNACMFNCRHCYNAGRKVADLPASEIKHLITKLQQSGAFVVNLTGGEPCLRSDLSEICGALNDDTAAIVSTTGYGFTDDMAKRLRDSGVYGVSLSLDSADEQGHDRTRGIKGAFRIALAGIETGLKHGFYTYTCAVPTRTTLDENNFASLVELNRRLGVAEIQILEPAPAGKLLNSPNMLEPADFEKIREYMARYNSTDDGPTISSFAHLESPEFFGCGAGFSHIYIDGTGEVSPCNMMPVTYGNAYTDDFENIIRKMQAAMGQPCRMCRAYAQRDYFQANSRQGKLIDATRDNPVPSFTDGLPGFYQVLRRAEEEAAGTDDIVTGYTRASETYDDYWLTVASGPVDELMRRMRINSGDTAVDCGCGTGYTTAKLARLVEPGGRVIGIDLTAAMVKRARERIAQTGLSHTEFRINNVLDELKTMEPDSIDLATITWLIGYVGCDEIFPALARVVKPGGQIGFVAHLDHSPKVPFDVFEDLIRQAPEVMDKSVRMKFPRCEDEIRASLDKCGFEPVYLITGTFTVVCRDGRDVYDHVMKSGAGTTFYQALRPSARQRLTDEFIRRVEDHFSTNNGIPIEHRYTAGIAVRED